MGNQESSSRGTVPRVAFFTDSFHEANGVALTSRQFAAFARTRHYPFLSIHAGPKTEHWKRGNFETLELAGSRLLLNLEHDLSFDLLFARHLFARHLSAHLGGLLRKRVIAFRPDLIHVTGPGHIGLLGAMLAHQLQVPLAASWHTNVHEFGSRRLLKLLRRAGWLTNSWAPAAARRAEETSLYFAQRFYRLARLVFAPNPELVRMLAQSTGHPVHLMQRGIDVDHFSPAHRPAAPDRSFTIGYVGRLSAEKNVRMFVELERELHRIGMREHRFLIVGEGSEREVLRSALPNACLPGLLRGEALSAAYASMDAFIFPSETDTFGNVVLEALASGVPAVVSSRGGPKYLVNDGATGFVARDVQSFAQAVACLYYDDSLRAAMSEAARAAALERKWESVFEGVYSRYRSAILDGILARPGIPDGSLDLLNTASGHRTTGAANRVGSAV